MHFRLIKTASSELWDYGWFDLSRFEVIGSCEERDDPAAIVHAFFLDPISQRSFCTLPDPWGVIEGHHGPFVHPIAAESWMRTVMPRDLGPSMKAAMKMSDLDQDPSAEQLVPLEAWSARVEAEGGSLFEIDVPQPAAIRVEWHYIWSLFREYVHVSPGGDVLTVAVIGYD